MNPAWALGVDHRMGSLEPGKDADVVLWSKSPFSVYAKAERVWIDGLPVYEQGKAPWSDFELGQGLRPKAPTSAPALLPGGAP
jgi:cytosine/adenosine deaminase-related metal-dependent hydrolase